MEFVYKLTLDPKSVVNPLKYNGFLVNIVDKIIPTKGIPKHVIIQVKSLILKWDQDDIPKNVINSLVVLDLDNFEFTNGVLTQYHYKEDKPTGTLPTFILGFAALENDKLLLTSHLKTEMVNCY